MIFYPLILRTKHETHYKYTFRFHKKKKIEIEIEKKNYEETERK